MVADVSSAPYRAACSHHQSLAASNTGSELLIGRGHPVRSGCRVQCMESATEGELIIAHHSRALCRMRRQRCDEEAVRSTQTRKPRVHRECHVAYLLLLLRFHGAKYCEWIRHFVEANGLGQLLVLTDVR